ncbi:hypothetical protein FAZ15_12125 [Sphingobacterium olei]|uniref:Tetratricopeptide repeat protein n=1 Tax=Sphingobacterium olei TaxID=2571155 RepID=A0A4U0P0Q0_9SPHI|nr:tetratricopeptide repeat protein [Sphingobacterium olei]TJZ60725.1 hypothetical protein FAZ15_12125 [Sphingobacterium olei]
MMKTSEEKIQDYIDGLLQGEELLAFEQELATDLQLREQLNLHREVQSILARRMNSGEDELRTNLHEAAHANRHSESDNKSKSLYRILVPILAAACILVVIKFSLSTSSTLYQLPIMESEIVRGSGEAGKYEDAVIYFNNQSFSEARDILNQLINSDSLNVQYKYYHALTYYGEENWSESIAELETIADGESVFAREATYYLAVAYSKENKNEKAILLLQQIKSDDELGRKANKLLKDMQ